MASLEVPTRKDGMLSREHFLLREFRIAAELRRDGMTDAQIESAATVDNIFQYPTTTEAARKARVVLQRLDALNSPQLVAAVAQGDYLFAGQANLYAMMAVYSVVRAFMVEEVATRLRTMDYSLTRADVNGFLAGYQAARLSSAPWSESTALRIGLTLRECLAGAGMLPDTGSDQLTEVYPAPDLVDVMRANGHGDWLFAFNGMGAM